MPQYRKLHVKSTESLDINEMPDDFTRLLWLLLPLIACCEGRGMDSPAWIKSKAMPLRCDVSFEQVEKAMRWYCGRGMVTRYTVAGRGYFQIVNWARYQGDTSREADSNYPGQDQADTDTNAQTDSRPTQELVASKSCSYTNTDANTNTDTCESAKPAPSASADLQAILSEWASLFPKKPQPKPTTATLQRQAATRMKAQDFRESWQQALAIAARSKFCNDGNWFDLYWFLKNDDNWRKCLAGNYGNGKDGAVRTPAKPVPVGDFIDPSEFFRGGTK